MMPVRLSRVLGSSLLFLALLLVIACGSSGPERGDRVRVGFFPNVTHAQMVIGLARGDFDEALGEGVELRSTMFNAGPSVIEAMYAGHLDIACIGPAPMIIGFIRSEGEEIRLVAGAAENGVLIVGSPGRGVTRIDQLGDVRLATPQIGNTQDISAKRYVTEELGSRLHTRGGPAQVLPIANPDIYNLFRQNQLDAAWLPEPWGSRLIHAGYAELIMEEKDLWPDRRFAMSGVIVRRKYLEEQPDNVRRVLEAHAAITREMQADPMAFAEMLQAEMAALTGAELPLEVVQSALGYVDFTHEIHRESYETYFQWGRELGIYRTDMTSLDGLFVDTLPEQPTAGGRVDAP